MVAIIGAYFVFVGVGIRQENTLITKYRNDPERKQYVEFIERNKKDLASHPDKAKKVSATMDMGLQWYVLHEYTSAVQWWEKGLKLRADNSIGWYNLGNAYRELKNYPKSESAYRKSIQYADQNELDGCLALGELYHYNYTEKSFEEPQVYLSCLQKFSNNRDLIARLAIYYRDIGDKEKATQYFDRLWSIEPSVDVSEELRKLRM